MTIWPTVGGGGASATSIVLQGWESSQSAAKTSFQDALTFLDNIYDVSKQLQNIPSIDEELGELTSTVSAFQAPTKPNSLDIDPQFKAITATPGLTDVAPLDIPNEPSFNEAEPDYRTLTAPAAFNKSAPTAPTLATRQYPDAPNEALPSAPSMRELTLPTPPEQLTINFDAQLPAALEDAPSPDFVYTESEYTSTLLDKINEKLLTFISGFSTGLPAEVEQQIWDRARRRTSVATMRLKNQNERYYSSSGWDIPGGDLQNKNYEAEQEAVNQDITESRSIAIAQAELEQKNFQFAFTTATQVEGMLINHFDSVKTRALDAAKYAIQAAIQLYELKVRQYNANIEAYTAQAQVYRDRIQAELSKVELYKAQLDGQRLISELNQQDIAIYRERINAVLAIYELYKAKLEAVKTQLQGDELILKQFESQIQAFESEVRAKGLEYENFKIENDVEMTKNEIYKARTQAYGERVNAFKTLIDARKAKQDADIRINQEIPLEVFKQEVESGKALIEAEAERLRALTDTTKANADIYESSVRAEGIRIDAESKVQETELKKIIAQSEIRIESLKANVSAYLASMELLSDAAKAGAQVASQLAAAMWSTVNLSASTSDSDSVSQTASSSVSSSTSINHNYNHSE